MTHLYLIHLVYFVKRRNLNLYTHYRNIGFVLILDFLLLFTYILLKFS